MRSSGCRDCKLRLPMHAAPTVAALVELAHERGEAKPYKSIGLTYAVAFWVK